MNTNQVLVQHMSSLPQGCSLTTPPPRAPLHLIHTLSVSLSLCFSLHLYTHSLSLSLSLSLCFSLSLPNARALTLSLYHQSLVLSHAAMHKNQKVHKIFTPPPPHNNNKNTHTHTHTHTHTKQVVMFSLLDSMDLRERGVWI